MMYSDRSCAEFFFLKNVCSQVPAVVLTLFFATKTRPRSADQKQTWPNEK